MAQTDIETKLRALVPDKKVVARHRNGSIEVGYVRKLYESHMNVLIPGAGGQSSYFFGFDGEPWYGEGRAHPPSPASASIFARIVPCPPELDDTGAEFKQRRLSRLFSGAVVPRLPEELVNDLFDLFERHDHV